MKLLRLKITDPSGFRSLPAGFEHHFRTEWQLQEDAARPEDGFAPFVCAGPNGSGKSNLLEALAAIFYQLEVQRVRRSFLPEGFPEEDASFPEDHSSRKNRLDAFELDYLIPLPKEFAVGGNPAIAHVRARKAKGEKEVSPGTFETHLQLEWLNASEHGGPAIAGERERDFLLPQYVLGYSSGENEILSLPFFKLRFVQFDEYWNSLQAQLPYLGRPETRLAYLDDGFSQAILLCNLLFQDRETLRPFREDVGIEALNGFRVVLRRRIEISPERAAAFGVENRALSIDSESGRHSVNILHLLEADEYLQAEIRNNPDSTSTRYDQFDPALTRLKRCATLSYEDEASDTMILDYWVNEATRRAFHENFDGSPLALFQAFQVLLTLNLFSVSDTLKADLYRSSSHYVSETVPTLASDQRIMRFKFVHLLKQGISEPMTLKELSDGEHQLLHSLGLCLLFRDTNSLFLLDEPETHFNPDWRANFISRLRECLPGNGDVSQEMLITTHTPFLISDSRREKVLVFSKDRTTGEVSVQPPEFNTLGASINKITMSEVFGKRETIGAYAQSILERERARFEMGEEDPSVLIDDINRELGDSVEKILLIREILGKAEGAAVGEQD